MSEEMAGDDPEGVSPEQVVGALYQGYYQFLTAHLGKVSPATATPGVLTAPALFKS